MGDAGAYSVGFFIAAISINLHNNYSAISSWAILLILFWPVADLLLSVVRRLIKKVDTKKPDFMHFHHVTLKLVELFTNNVLDRKKANPITTILLAPLSCLPAIIATLFYDNPIVCFISFLCFTFLFLTGYIISKNFAKKLSSR